MKRMGIFCNLTRQENIPYLEQIISCARENGYDCSINKDDGIGFDDLPDMNEMDSIEFVTALGGDGTILRAASVASKKNLPLLGVNRGRRGFLSQIEVSEFTQALQRIGCGDYIIDIRMMAECEVGCKSYVSLNDFTLYKRYFSGVAHIGIRINGEDAGDVFCDGLVISTPTGSTAYSLSAGGPVIAKDLEALIITPICPHSLSFRPIVVKSNATLEFTMFSEGALASDGEISQDLENGSQVIVHSSEHTCDLIKLKKRNIYRLIREKLT